MSILDNMNLFGPAAEQLMAQNRAKMDVTRDLAEKHGAKLPYMAAQFAPGMGVQDAAGENPGLPPTGSELVDIFAAPNDPSMRENIQAGGPLNYLMAAGQGLGVLGDAMYAAPAIGVALGPTVGTALKGTGMAAKGAAKGIASLTRPVFPAPQRMFDPANKSFNPSLSDFDYEPGGRYLQMGKDKTDITGQIPQAGKISVGPDGKPSFMVSDNLVDSLPTTGNIIRTNLYKKQAGWKWTKPPEGFDPNPPSSFPLVSVERGKDHYYTLATDFPDGVELARYPGKTSEPRLRPTTRGDLQLGKQIGEIVTPQGKKHPVYDQITAGQVKGIASIPPKAEPKDMVFVHNTSEEAIKSFDNMGGIPSPSIAVTKADQPFSGFGQIQLIGKPEKFDPAIDPRNKIYSSDAYTPRAPKKLRLAKPGADKQIAKDYAGMEIKNLNADYILKQGQDALRNLQKNNLFNPENRTDELNRFFDSGLAKTKFYQEIGRDPADLKSKPFPQKKYNKWVREQENKYLDQEGVFQYFDDFEETTKTVPYTLDNVVNNMVQETQRGGEKGLGMVGANRLQAFMAEEFSDLPGIKSQKGRISRRDSATSYVDIEDDIYQSLIKNIDEMKFKPHELNQTDLVSGDAMYAAEKLQEAVGENLESGMNIEKAIKAAYTDQAYYLDLPEMMPKVVYDDMQKSFTANAIRPVEYFEAKPTRAVGFDEFAGAIVGEGTSKEVIDILEKRGLKVIKQSMDDLSKDFGKNKARQAFKEQFFSVAPIAAAAGAMTMQEEEDLGIGSL